MLEIKDGTLSIGGHQLFSNLSFCTAEGGLTAVTGPHGCGKTSLLRAFLGFQPLDSGYVSVDAEPVLPQTSALFRAGMLYETLDQSRLAPPMALYWKFHWLGLYTLCRGWTPLIPTG